MAAGRHAALAPSSSQHLPLAAHSPVLARVARDGQLKGARAAGDAGVGLAIPHIAGPRAHRPTAVDGRDPIGARGRPWVRAIGLPQRLAVQAGVWGGRAVQLLILVCSGREGGRGSAGGGGRADEWPRSQPCIPCLPDHSSHSMLMVADVTPRPHTSCAVHVGLVPGAVEAWLAWGALSRQAPRRITHRAGRAGRVGGADHRSHASEWEGKHALVSRVHPVGVHRHKLQKRAAIARLEAPHGLPAASRGAGEVVKREPKQDTWCPITDPLPARTGCALRPPRSRAARRT